MFQIFGLSGHSAPPLPAGNDEEMAKPGFSRIPDVKRPRESLGRTQEAFAAAYRIPVGTLRDWEQGRKRPDAPARAYLTVIARNSKVVADLLRDAA